jgi:alpha-mannosidase
MHHQIRWTIQKIENRLKFIEPLVYRQRQLLASFKYRELPDPTTPPPLQADVSNWQIIEPYSYWVKAKTNFALQLEFSVPANWGSTTPIALYFPLGEPASFSHPEALIYINGEPLAATDRHHQEVLLPAKYADGQSHTLMLHGWSGNTHKDGEEARLFMRPCEVVQLDQPTRDFIATARVALGVASNIEANNPAKDKLLNALDDAFKVLDIREPISDAFYASIPESHTILRTGIDKAGSPMDVTIAAAGHAHIDVAWLWTLAQTRRKSGRTFHTVMQLMEQFPDYKFTQSQPQLYDYLRQDYPELFQAIKQRVAEERWELIGGMWVEADCNVSGGESLARQFLLGRNFFRQHFGDNQDSPVLWLPDVFGYAWALPQLIKKAGLDYFMTIKIGWNQYNRLPYDSFWWQGIDGTQVLTHFSTSPTANQVSTYNASATPKEALGTWNNFQQKETQSEMLMSFGYGDGGGGPTREMLENIREMNNFPVTPQMRHETVANFFERIDAQAGDQLPTWNGELYLEYHRGTYTTQALTKRGNRKSEFLLHDAEFLAAFAAMTSDFVYPLDEFTRLWQLVCLNQFHDILPGSSIAEVYVDSLEQYADVAQSGEAICAAALSALARGIGGDVVVLNPTSFPRADLVLWDGELPEGQTLWQTSGDPVLTQTSEEGTWIGLPQWPSYSLTALRLEERPLPEAATGLTVSPRLLENNFIRVELNDAGDIMRIFDKEQQRELLPEGAVANQFQCFEDRSLAHDAWDIDIFYDDKMWLSDPAESIVVVEEGPLRATLEIKRRILNSAYTQRISLDFNSGQVTIDTSIDWQERRILLKVAFPVDILTPQATYEIQWGNVQRPTHQNTSWDWARFETCAQKWVDLSEGDYGLSLLNDCKYGHDIHDNVMRITLLRATTAPDPMADVGMQQFRYALLPHSGDWRNETIPAAYALNDPLRAVAGAPGAESSQKQFMAVDAENVIIETIKQAEDGRGIIVRLYESQRRRGEVTVQPGFPLQAAMLTNLLEDDETQLETDGATVKLPIKPYEIITLRLIPRH